MICIRLRVRKDGHAVSAVAAQHILAHAGAEGRPELSMGQLGTDAAIQYKHGVDGIPANEHGSLNILVAMDEPNDENGDAGSTDVPAYDDAIASLGLIAESDLVSREGSSGH